MSTLDLSAFYGQFREETEEHVRALSDGLLVLESNPTDRATIDAIFRAAHTIKGSARMLGQHETGRLAHTMEHVLGVVRAGTLAFTSRINDALLASCDVLLHLAHQVGDPPPTDERVTPLIQQLEALLGAAAVTSPAPITAPTAPPTPAPVPAPIGVTESAPAAPRSSGGRSTVRVPISRLDRLLNTTGELVVSRQMQSAHAAELSGLVTQIATQQRTMDSLIQLLQRLRGPTSVRNDVQHKVTTLYAALQQTQNDLYTIVDRWNSHATSVASLVDELEAEVMATRLQPVAGLFAPIPRAVRELARALEKEVTLITTGETTEADRKVLEVLSEPLLHLVRNALDHGIEPAEHRVAAGKPREATLSLSARSLGNSIEIEIADDGRGIDPAALRQNAIRKGIIDADGANRLSDDEALELIWQPGFSTSSLITDVSGRGVGMDVVRTAVIEIGGRVEVQSTVGRGTQIILTLPVTLLTTHVVLFEASGGVYALPSTACIGGHRLHGDDVQMIGGRPMLRYAERLVPVVALAPLLDQRGPLPDPSAMSTILLLGPHQRPLGLLVTRLLDEREVVIKGLGPVLSQQRVCTGAIATPDGRLVLLLNPATLIERAREAGRAAAPAPRHTTATARLLVVEDSFTTRELLRSILQSAGYIVETAIHGRDALDKLRTNSYDLVVSDVEMPQMNGFELTRRVRSDQHLAHMPIIIITSLAREADRREGLLAGAQAYIVKSQFDQSNLLETIQQLLGR